MDTLYNTTVGYERMKNLTGMVILIILGVCFISSACSSIYSNFETVNTTGTVVSYDTPSETAGVQYSRGSKQQTDNIVTSPVTIGSKIPIHYNSSGTNTASLGQSSTGSSAWMVLCCIACVCFIVAFISYYMATSKSMENVLAAQGALNAASTIGRILRRRGGYFDVGE
jgi:hypothetical protein